MAGPLEGLKVIEMAGLEVAPFCAMLLADMGADVIPDRTQGPAPEAMSKSSIRGRPAPGLDLRAPGVAGKVLDLAAVADVLIEGFRPGVMERMGLGPSDCLARNPRLVYGRMTGWGQDGPLAQTAGHDINYIAITGALHAIGRPDEPPAVPLNYIGDFGGGAMLLAFGVLSALYETQRSGKGQVVDAAMIDGAALLSAMMYGMKATGGWTNRRGENMLDGGAAFPRHLCMLGWQIPGRGRHRTPVLRSVARALRPERRGVRCTPMDERQWPESSNSAWWRCS